MTQPGETDGYSVWKHIEAIINHVGENIVDYVVVNNEEIPIEVLQKYAIDGADPVILSEEERKVLFENKIKIIETPLLDIKKDYIRHDANKLCHIITELKNSKLLI